jgi:dolichyl-phosphate-mannose--protein O-mannosyl transferase
VYRHLPPITRRVVSAIVVLSVGIATNAWHKNVISGLAITISTIALSVWLGLWVSNPGTGKEDHP